MIKPVYTIVFFQDSPPVFKNFPDKYIHFFKQQSDTGLDIELLQRYIFISLDRFRALSQNIDSDLNAWLTFLSSDDPNDIMYLIETHPEFKPLYDTLFNLCSNVEGVMNMFSKELFELDRNTVHFMVDELSREVKQLKDDVAEKDNTIADLMAKIKELENKQ